MSRAPAAQRIEAIFSFSCFSSRLFSLEAPWPWLFSSEPLLPSLLSSQVCARQRALGARVQREQQARSPESLRRLPLRRLRFLLFLLRARRRRHQPRRLLPRNGADPRRLRPAFLCQTWFPPFRLPRERFSRPSRL